MGGKKIEGGCGRQVAGEKIVSTLIMLTAESAGGATTLMTVRVSAVSTTAFYGGPDGL